MISGHRKDLKDGEGDGEEGRGCRYVVASPGPGTGKTTDLKQTDDALQLAARDAPRYISKLRLSIFRGKRADGAVVKTMVPSYKMKCPSLRKMKRNEELFVSSIHVELFFNFLIFFGPGFSHCMLPRVTPIRHIAIMFLIPAINTSSPFMSLSYHSSFAFNPSRHSLGH